MHRRRRKLNGGMLCTYKWGCFEYSLCYISSNYHQNLVEEWKQSIVLCSATFHFFGCWYLTVSFGMWVESSNRHECWDEAWREGTSART